MEENTNNVTPQDLGTNKDNELETRLAEAEARAAQAEEEAKRFKASIDKLTKEAAEKKREERAKMSEEDKRKAEQEEEFARLKEKAEADAKELNHLRAVTAYKDIEDSDVVEKLIDAVADADHVAIMKIIADVKEKAIKEKEAEWKKSRPAGYVGSGSFPTKTKEEILAIQDDEERILEIAKHPELFPRS